MTLTLKNLACMTTTTVFFGLTIGFSSIKPTSAKSLSTTPSTTGSQNLSFTIAQNTPQLIDAKTPIYGAWKLRYSVDGIVYESFLKMQGNSGTMRTRFFSPNVDRTEIVDQTMQLRSSAEGLILLGSHPVYGGTTISHPTYSPDNFLFRINPDGSKEVFTCDYLKQCSPVNLETL